MRFEVSREMYLLNVKAKILRIPKQTSPLDRWSTERYRLFTKSKQGPWVGEVSHQPWSLEAVELIQFEDHFSKLIGLNLNYVPDEIAYARQLQVCFEPFRLKKVRAHGA